MNNKNPNSEYFINFKDSFAQSLRQIDPCFYLDQAWLMMQPVLNEGSGKNYSDKKINFARILDIKDVSTSPLMMGLHFLRLSSFERLIYILRAGIENKNYFTFSTSVNPRKITDSIMNKDWQSEMLQWLDIAVDAGSFHGDFPGFFLNELQVFHGGRNFRNAYKHGRMIQEAHGIEGTPNGIRLLNEKKRKDFWFSYFEKSDARLWYTLYRTEPNADLHSLNLQAKLIDKLKSSLGHDVLKKLQNSPRNFQPIFGAHFMSISDFPEGETWLQSQIRHGETHKMNKTEQTHASEA